VDGGPGDVEDWPVTIFALTTGGQAFQAAACNESAVVPLVALVLLGWVAAVRPLR